MTTGPIRRIDPSATLRGRASVLTAATAGNPARAVALGFLAQVFVDLNQSVQPAAVF